MTDGDNRIITLTISMKKSEVCGMWLTFLKFIPNVISGLFGLGGNWLEKLKSESETKQSIELQKQVLVGEIELSKLAAKRDVIKSGGDWEVEQAKNSATSWKDEFWTIVLGFPFISVSVAPFIDMFMDSAPYQKGDINIAVASSLDAMALFPEWYQVLLFVAVGASFGVRVFDRFSSKKGKLVYNNQQ